MARKQYIGPRFVIKIYENSENPLSAEWERNTHYEPLIMVTYQNSSYISRIDVPSTVGNPVDNPRYWALTGYYNGQIAALQTQMQQLQEDMDELADTVGIGNYFKDKKIVVYGDSISDRANAYTHVLEDDYGLDITNRAVAGSFLTTPALSGLTPGITMLQGAIDLNDFDICFIQYGTNDWQIGRSVDLFKSTVEDAIRVFDGLSCEPIFILPPFGELAGGVTVNSAHATIEAYVDAAIDVCIANHVKYINLNTLFPARKGSEEPWLENQSFYLHPSDLGAKMVADIIVAGLFNTGKCFTGTTECAGMIRSLNVPDISVLPASVGKARGNVFSIRSDQTLATTTAQMVNSQHSYKVHGVLHTNDSNGINIRVAFLNASDAQETFTAHDGDVIDVYGQSDGRSAFVYMTFNTSNVNTLYAYIDEFSFMVDCDAYPMELNNISAVQNGITIDSGGRCYVENGYLNFDPLQITCANGVTEYTAFARLPVSTLNYFFVSAVCYDESDLSNIYKQKAVIIRGNELICNETIPNGSRLYIVIPPIPTRPFSVGNRGI